jgi:hypothetical protein
MMDFLKTFLPSIIGGFVVNYALDGKIPDVSRVRILIAIFIIPSILWILNTSHHNNITNIIKCYMTLFQNTQASTNSNVPSPDADKLNQTQPQGSCTEAATTFGVDAETGRNICKLVECSKNSDSKTLTLTLGWFKWANEACTADHRNGLSYGPFVYRIREFYRNPPARCVDFAEAVRKDIDRMVSTLRSPPSIGACRGDRTENSAAIDAFLSENSGQ